MGRSFYHQEVSMIAQQYVSSYNGYFSTWQYIYPMWDYALQSYQMLGQYVAQNLTTADQIELFEYVVYSRRNYTDFPISAMRMVQQQIDWMHANVTFIAADCAVFLVELDSALRLVDIILSGRPECGQQDRSQFIQAATQNVSQALTTSFSYMMSGNSYLAQIVNQQALQNFQSLFSMAVMDMFDPLRALQQLELNFFETNRALIRMELENLSRAVSYYLNSGLLVALTNQRDWLLNLMQTIDTLPCQYPDQYAPAI